MRRDMSAPFDDMACGSAACTGPAVEKEDEAMADAVSGDDVELSMDVEEVGR